MPKTAQLTSERIQDALYGFTRSQILFAALDIDVFTHIAQGEETLDALTEALDVDRRGLRILLDGLVGIGFLQKKNHTGLHYELPEDVARYLVRNSEEYMGGMVSHCKRLYENWSQLTDAVRTGQPAGGAHGLAALEAFFSELVKGLYVSNYPTAKKLAKVLEMGKSLKDQHILDVAGGSGVWSIALLETDKSSQATLLDFPTVISVAREYVDHHGLTDRYHFWPEDLEETEFPDATFDMVILANICHALGPVATQRLLQSMGKTLKPGGRVVIVDFVPDDERAKAGWPLIFGVNMLISTPEGDVFTQAEYERWMREAGFTRFERKDVENEVTALIGIK